MIEQFQIRKTAFLLAARRRQKTLRRRIQASWAQVMLATGGDSPGVNKTEAALPVSAKKKQAPEAGTCLKDRGRPGLTRVHQA